MDTFLNHQARDAILQKSEVSFVFIERDETNLAHLKEELVERTVPSGVIVRTLAGDCFAALQDLIQWFSQPGRRLAPAFFFVDPYGFKVPGKVLRELMRFQRVELFINVIWRELDMALRQPETMGETLDLVFDSGSWRDRISATSHIERTHQTAELIKGMTGARCLDR